jgi:hypothetical protein
MSEIFDAYRTIHFIGDLHLGGNANGVSPEDKAAILENDLLNGDLPRVAARIQLGDGVDNAAPSEDRALREFFSRLAAGGAPVDRMLPGNHDLMVSANGTLRGAESWAASVGPPAVPVPWTLDLDFCRIVGIGQSDHANNDWTICASAKDLDYLDRAVGSTSKPVVVCCHAPLYDTVMGPGENGQPQFLTTENLFWCHTPDVNGADDQAIRDVIGSHRNVIAWAAGHTHSDAHAPGFFKPMTVGCSTLVHASASAIYYVGRTPHRDHPVRSVYLTILDDALEFRIRDHGKAGWIGRPGTGAIARFPR